MRRSLIVSFLASIAFINASGQTPVSVSRLAGRPPTTPGGDVRTAGVVAGNNPWLLAADLSIKPLAGGGGFSEQWLLSAAKVVYDLPLDGDVLGGAHFPIMANLADILPNLGEGSKKDSLDAAIQSLVTSSDGINVGVYPFWPLTNKLFGVRATVFTGISAKWNEFNDTTANTKQTLLTGRFSGGLEFSIGDETDGKKPLTVSLSAVHSRFGADAYQAVFKERRSTLNSAELTAILPIQTGVGILFEGIGVEQKKPAFRLGLLMAGGKKSPAETETSRQTPTVACANGCKVTVKTAGNLPADAHITTDPTPDVLSINPQDCVLRQDGSTCTFTVRSGKSITLKSTGGGVLFTGNGCNGGTCQVTASDAISITVTKSTP